MDKTDMTISKNRFLIVCVLALILFIALVWCLLQFDSKAKGRSDYDEASTGPDVVFLPVIKADGTAEFFHPDGSKAQPCGKLNGSKVEGECNLGGDWISFNTITIVGTKSSPGCINVYDGAGNLLFRKHDSGTYKNYHPCHSGNTPRHRK